MKVLITGGFGFIGSHITDIMLKNNIEVVIIDNLSSGTLSNIPKFDMTKFYQLDIAQDDIECVFAKEKPDYCIHLAAQTSVAYSILHTKEDAIMNIISSIKVLDLCKKYNIKKFITASSAAVYGVPQYLPIDEEHPTKPISNYGLSKLTMEKYIELSGVPYIIFRFANVYGPRQVSSKESGVVAIFNDEMIKNGEINIYGDGNQIRDFVYVEDIANICYEAIKDNVVNEIINVSCNRGVSVNDLYIQMAQIYNYYRTPIHMSERSGDIRDSVLSNKKACELFKNFTNVSLEQGLLNLKKANCEGEISPC